jgi:predicted nucleic acid-binding protein
VRLVVDSSFILASLLAETRAEFAAETLADVAYEDLLAPALLPFEVGNVLRTRVRSGRLSPAERDARLRMYFALGVVIEPPPTEPRLLQSGVLSADHDLTIYDAAYLEAALRNGAALATFDVALASGARALDVPVVTA